VSAVASIEAIPIGYEEPNDHGRTRHVTLIKLVDDDGVVGWGESVTYWPEASRAVVALVDGLREVVVGADPLDTEGTWRALRKHMWWYGNGGVASIALAGIDIAMWDLKGKRLDARVLDLLGGPVKEQLPAIASGHAAKADLGALAEDAAVWTATGLHGMKIGFGKRGDARLGYEHDRDVEYVRRVREALGPDKSFMVDLGVNTQWTVAEAVRRIRAFEEHAVDWVEEPLGHFDPDGYRELRAKTQTKIAYGEKEFGLEGVQRLLESGTCDVLGFDPGRAEGLTAFRHAVTRVEAARREANAHAWSTAIVSAASLAISWSTPVCRQFEVKPLRDVAQFELVAEPLAHSGGFMPQPQGPGLGIEVREDVVQRLRLDA
jgi:L-alanine-DL-glutamate epimerase-like enolase superfamily enzyme